MNSRVIYDYTETIHINFILGAFKNDEFVRGPSNMWWMCCGTTTSTDQRPQEYASLTFAPKKTWSHPCISQPHGSMVTSSFVLWMDIVDYQVSKLVLSPSLMKNDHLFASMLLFFWRWCTFYHSCCWQGILLGTGHSVTIGSIPLLQYIYELLRTGASEEISVIALASMASES